MGGWCGREIEKGRRGEKWERLKDRGGERIERGAGLHCITTISSKHISPLSLSFPLFIPILGYGPRPASVFYLYPVAQHPGGVRDFVSWKTGCVYREMRKTLLGELNHWNPYMLSR